MNVRLYYVFITLFLMVVLHFISNSLGWYETPIVWVDNVLHIMAGGAFALLWIWLIQRKYIRYSRTPLNIVIFVITMAIVWELIEFAFFRLFPTTALELSIYSPSILEALSDVASNALGGLLVSRFIK